MDSGKLVPDELIIDALMEDATPYLEEGRSLLLDGFPRTLQQAEALEKVAHIDLVVNLEVPDQTIVERISDRWIHPASGRIYSYSYKPPKVVGKDDVTGEPLVQREDDKPEAVKSRLGDYDAVTAPLVEYYAEQGILETFRGTMSDVIYPEVRPRVLVRALVRYLSDTAAKHVRTFLSDACTHQFTFNDVLQVKKWLDGKI